MLRSRLPLILLLAVCGCNSGGGGGSSGGGGGQLQEARFDGLPDEASADLSKFVIRSRWQKSELTYFINNVSPDLADGAQRQIIAQAFDTWA